MGNSRINKKLKRNCSNQAMHIEDQKEQTQSENFPPNQTYYTLQSVTQEISSLPQLFKWWGKKKTSQLMGMNNRKWNYLAGCIEKFKNPIIPNKLLHNFITEFGRDGTLNRKSKYKKYFKKPFQCSVTT